MLFRSIHVASSAFMLYFGFRDSTGLLIWVAAVAATGFGFWALARPKNQGGRGQTP